MPGDSARRASAPVDRTPWAINLSTRNRPNLGVRPVVDVLRHHVVGSSRNSLSRRDSDPIRSQGTTRTPYWAHRCAIATWLSEFSAAQLLRVDGLARRWRWEGPVVGPAQQWSNGVIDDLGPVVAMLASMHADGFVRERVVARLASLSQCGRPRISDLTTDRSGVSPVSFLPLLSHSRSK